MTLNPVSVHRFLGGLDFPVSKDDLIFRARENNAPEPILSELDRLPEQTYGNVREVSKALAGLEA